MLRAASSGYKGLKKPEKMVSYKISAKKFICMGRNNYNENI